MWKTKNKETVLDRTSEMELYLEKINELNLKNPEELNFEKERINKFINFTLNLIEKETKEIGEVQYYKYEDPQILQEKNKILLVKINNYYKNLSFQKTEQIINNNNNLNHIVNGTPINYEKIKKQSEQKQFNSNDLIAKIFTIIGLLLLLGSSIALFAANYENLPDWSKGVIVALMGIALTGYGAFNCRKQTNLFGCCIMSGGISIIFSAIALSGFYLELMDPYIIMIVTIFTALLSIFLALKYDSQLIAVFSVVGGFLPLLQLSKFEESIILLLYFVIISIISIIIFSKKKWSVLKYVNLFFGSITAAILSSLLLNEWISAGNDILAFAYCLIFFILHSSVSLFEHYFNSKEEYKLSDTIYDIITASLYTLILLNVEDILLVPAGIYYVILSVWLNKTIKNTTVSSNTFFILGITFIVSIITNRIAPDYLYLTWLVETIIFAIKGYLQDSNIFKKISWIMFFASIMSMFFIMADNYDMVSPIPYLIMVIAYFGLTELAYKYEDNHIFTKIAKIINGIFVALFFSYLFSYIMEEKIFTLYDYSIRYDDKFNIETFCLYLALFTTAIFFICWIFNALRQKDKTMIITLIAFSAILTLIGTFVSYSNPVEYYRFTDIDYTQTFNFDYRFMNIMTGIIHIATFITLVYINAKLICMLAGASTKSAALVSTLYGLIIFSMKMFENFLLIESSGLSNIILTIVYFAIAALWMTKGLINNYNLMKILGLILSIISLLKICIFDTSFMSDNTRPIAYIICAIICFVIVKVYTHFSKKYSD